MVVINAMRHSTITKGKIELNALLFRDKCFIGLSVVIYIQKRYIEYEAIYNLQLG
jgi:hypothetical protein